VVVESNIIQGATFFRFDLTVTDDAGPTAFSYVHGLGAIPLAAGPPFAGLGPAQVSFLPLDTAYYASQWLLENTDSTYVRLLRTAAVGSGSANPQIRVTVQLPHSIGR
jgi:hypothetical protein